jgi:hypothetical protein
LAACGDTDDEADVADGAGADGDAAPFALFLFPQPVSRSNPANTATPMLFQPLIPASMFLFLSCPHSMMRHGEEVRFNTKTPPDSGGRSLNMNVCASDHTTVALPPSYAGTNQIRYKGLHHRDALSAGRMSSSPGAYGIVETFFVPPLL